MLLCVRRSESAFVLDVFVCGRLLLTGRRRIKTNKHKSVIGHHAVFTVLLFFRLLGGVGGGGATKEPAFWSFIVG